MEANNMKKSEIRYTSFFFFLFLTLLLFSCAPIHIESGNQISLKQIEAIEKGKTTREEVKDLMGEPQLTGKDDNGLDTWTYLHIEADLPIRGGKAKERFQRLTVTFEEETVKSTNYELSRE